MAVIVNLLAQTERTPPETDRKIAACPRLVRAWCPLIPTGIRHVKKFFCFDQCAWPAGRLAGGLCHRCSGADAAQHDRDRHGAGAAPSELGGAVRNRYWYSGDPDICQPAAVRQGLECAALPGRKLGVPGRRQVAAAEAGAGCDVPRWQTHHLGGRCVFYHGDQGQPSVPVDVRTGRAGRHPDPADRHHPAQAAASSHFVGAVAGLLPDHSQTHF